MSKTRRESHYSNIHLPLFILGWNHCRNESETKPHEMNYFILKWKCSWKKIKHLYIKRQLLFFSKAVPLRLQIHLAVLDHFICFFLYHLYYPVISFNTQSTKSNKINLLNWEHINICGQSAHVLGIVLPRLLGRWSWNNSLCYGERKLLTVT